MKRTFVVPDEKEEVYEKFKASVPEVSSKLVELMEEYVRKHEAVSEQMVEQTIYDGTDNCGIFKGDTFKFYGVLLVKDKHTTLRDLDVEIYLTKKGKFLVQITKEEGNKPIESYKYKVYEDYFEMKEKENLSNNLLKPVEEYLNKNSVVRTFKILDI